MPDAGDRARARRIIDRVRSYGVQVREMTGHENRGGTFRVVPRTVIDHHDASSRKSGEWGALGLIMDGSPRGIPGPLANVQIPRCLDNIPKIAWVADGACSHAGLGGPVPSRGLRLNDANRDTYGVEKANDGLGEPYTAASNYATNAVFHAMAVECGLADPGSMPFGHKEWTTRKSDPTYSMNERRRQVAAFTQEDDMAFTIDQFLNYDAYTGGPTFSQVLKDLHLRTQDVVRTDGDGNEILIPMLQEIADAKTNTLRLDAKVDALTDLVRTMAAAPGSGLGSDEVESLLQRVDAQIEESLAQGVDVRITVGDQSAPST